MQSNTIMMRYFSFPSLMQSYSLSKSIYGSSKLIRKKVNRSLISSYVSLLFAFPIILTSFCAKLQYKSKLIRAQLHDNQTAKKILCKLTIMLILLLYNPLIKHMDADRRKSMQFERTYYKGDYVFAETQGFDPYPAVVTAVCANNIYRVKFIDYKSTATIESFRMEPFEENIVKYERLYEKDKNVIFKKMQIAKKKMKKTSKSKKVDKTIRAISNVESSASQIPIRLEESVKAVKGKCIENEDDSFIELSNSVYAKKKPIKIEAKKAKKPYVPKINPKSKECKEILENLAELSPIVNEQSLFTDHQGHDAENLHIHEGKYLQQPNFSALHNNIFISKFSEQTVNQCPQIFQQEIKQQEYSYHEVPQNLNQVKLQQIDELIQSEDFTKVNQLNLCFDLDLDDLDLSYDQLSVEEDDYQRIAQSQRYRSCKISIFSPQDNIQRLSGYLDLLLLHFSQERKRYRPHCVLSIKKQQQLIAILQDRSIKFVHFLAFNTIFKMAQFIFSFESAHPKIKQCCIVEYFNIRAKLNVLSEDFRFNMSDIHLPDGVIESLKATLILYQKHTVIIK